MMVSLAREGIPVSRVRVSYILGPDNPPRKMRDLVKFPRSPTLSHASCSLHVHCLPRTHSEPSGA